MNVFITGLNGFIASHLARWFADRGHIVKGTSRSGSERFLTTVWRFGEPIEAAILANVDLVIHAAHDFTPGAMKSNLEGTVALERAATVAGVRRQILISSISARPDARSEYGRTKLEEEEYFLSQGHTVVRPGTVLGKGGIFGKMADLMQRLPVVPLLDGGRAHMTVVGIDDVCRAVEIIVKDHKRGPHNLYYEEMPTFGDLLRLLARILGRKILFVPIPAALVFPPLWLLSRLSVQTPIDVDNLKGYITGLIPYHQTNLTALLLRPSTWQAALADSWES
jgi:NADH dehydrogenase